MYEELKQQLFDYNWDDGFSFPQNLLNNDECDLALALDIFYLADGYGYIQNYPNVDYGTEDWLNFIETLMKDIIEDRYKNEDIASAEPTELPDKEQVIYVYCRSGNRSKQASAKLAAMGYTNIVEFGGILDWTGEVEK